MAITTSPNLFPGEFLAGLNSAKFLSGSSITSDLWRIEPTSADRAIVKLFNLGDESSVGTPCDITPSASASTMADKRFDLEFWTLNKTICKSQFFNTSYAEMMASGVLNAQIPIEVVQAFLSNVAKNEGNKLENIRWSGDIAGGAGYYADADGIITKLLAYGTYVPVTPTNPTASNDPALVIGEINKVLAETPLNVRLQPNFKLILAPKVAYAYQEAVASNLALAFIGNSQPKVDVNFIGYFSNTGIPMYLVPGLATIHDDVIMAGNFSNDMDGNLVLATNALNDYTYLQMTDLQPATGQPNVNFLWSATMGVDIIRPEEVVLYIN